MNISSDSACHIRGTDKKYIACWSSKVFLGEEKSGWFSKYQKILLFFLLSLQACYHGSSWWVCCCWHKAVLLCSAFKGCRLPHTISRLCWLQEAFSCSWPHWTGIVLTPNSRVGIRAIPSFTGTTEFSAWRRKRLTQPFTKCLWQVCSGSPSYFDSVLVYFWQKQNILFWAFCVLFFTETNVFFLYWNLLIRRFISVSFTALLSWAHVRWQ